MWSCDGAKGTITSRNRRNAGKGHVVGKPRNKYSWPCRGCIVKSPHVRKRIALKLESTYAWFTPQCFCMSVLQSMRILYVCFCLPNLWPQAINEYVYIQKKQNGCIVKRLCMAVGGKVISFLSNADLYKRCYFVDITTYGQRLLNHNKVDDIYPFRVELVTN